MATESNVTTFKRGLGNGAASLAAFEASARNVIETRNANELAQMLDAAAAKNDSNALSFFRKLTGILFDGATVGKNKKGGYVVRIKKATVNKDAFNDLAVAVKAGLSFRSNDARKLIGTSTETAFDAAKDAQNTAKRLAKNGADLEAYIAALRTAFNEQAAEALAKAA